jgi:DNA-binding FadR family transcriptional regulator
MRSSVARGSKSSYFENSAVVNPAKADNLTFRIEENLGVAIVTGKYSEHNPFPVEAELCKEFGVSRSILREAVKMLTAKGLLNARPRHGTWVQPEENWNLLDPDVLRWLLERKLSIRLLIEFTQIRLAVEPMAAALAARTASPEAKQTILAALNRMKAAENGKDDSLAADIAFHVSVLRASGNRFFWQLRELIHTALGFSMRVTNRAKGAKNNDVATHKKACDAILAGDEGLAEQAMRDIIQEALELIEGAKDAHAGGYQRGALGLVAAATE